LPKSDVFGVAAITRRRLTDQHCREGDFPEVTSFE
jgi:hypothetical protein